MTLEEWVDKTETRQVKAIFPGVLNANSTLFGGEAMKWMDEVAYITATRFTKQRMFTVTTDKVRFLKAIEPGSIAEVVGRVEKAESVKLTVKIEIFMEEMYGDNVVKAMEATFVFAMLDDNLRPRRIKYPFEFSQN